MAKRLTPLEKRVQKTLVLNKKIIDNTYPLSGSKAISLGSSSPVETKVCWLLPDKSDFEIVLYVVSLQYNSDVLH